MGMINTIVKSSLNGAEGKLGGRKVWLDFTAKSRRSAACALKNGLCSPLTRGYGSVELSVMKGGCQVKIQQTS